MSFETLDLVRVATDAGVVHFRAGKLYGERPLIVVLHGYDQQLHHLTHLASKLHDCDLIYGLLPGHSAAPVIENPTVETCARAFTAALDRSLPNRSFVLVGNSLGGLIGMAMATAPPAKMESVVAIEPFLDGEVWPLRQVLATKATVFSTAVLRGSYLGIVERMQIPCTVIAGDQPLEPEGQAELPSLLRPQDRKHIRQHARLVEIEGGHHLAAENPEGCELAIRLVIGEVGWSIGTTR